MQESLKILPDFTDQAINDRLKFIRAVNAHHKNSFAEDVLTGLTSYPKTLQPKYFYDSHGSKLFEQICSTPEYYITRTESSILKKCSYQMAELNVDKQVIVELGSGSSVKTKYILDAFIKNGPVTYIPIDVSEILLDGGKKLIEDFEGLKVQGIIGEYEESIELVNDLISEPKLIIFLGSSIGNFDLTHAGSFLNHLSCNMHEDDTLLIGFDLVKDVNVLNAAYDDAGGVTAGFNLNLLSRINRELMADFDLSVFSHKAFFNKEESRVEMHLVSNCRQDVNVSSLGKVIHFEENETIHTENSYKFTDNIINELAANAGLKKIEKWKDEDNYFELCMMKK
ncbi:MAG: L-histidine N(alpha)-methyltransferase [Ignavibacteria bacterium]|nr:L-histidine N(alpha)-methyltransferase [Ignavibacteria bacterium]